LVKHDYYEVLGVSRDASVEDIKREAMYTHAASLAISLDPRTADALRKAALDRSTTMESLASMAIEVWLKGWKYL
jgi:preprotein translocase subunit Sec63